jgi:coenzyme F420 hydrogenase subunit beta
MTGCPADVNFPKLSKELFGQVPEPLDVIGVFRKVYVGYSLDPKIRSRGSSGGVVTELLLYMLRKGLIDQALVCGMAKDRPWEPNPVLAETEKEIINSAQSKYTIVPQMRRIKQIMNSRKKVAMVGIPCHIHAYRKFESWQGNITENLQLVIGLGCISTLEIGATRKLLQISGIKLEELKKLEYRRGKAWPGAICATLRNGEVRSLHSGNIKDAYKRLVPFYTPERCLKCIDFSAELSDLTVMDAWFQDNKGEYTYTDGFSLIIVRNNKAQRILEQAVADGSLFIKDIPIAMLLSHFNSVVKYKKTGSSIRIEKLRKKGYAYPNYNLKFPKPKLRDKLDEKINSTQRILAKSEWTRHMGMRLAFSQFGNNLTEFWNAYKKRTFALKCWWRDRRNEKAAQTSKGI